MADIVCCETKTTHGKKFALKIRARLGTILGADFFVPFRSALLLAVFSVLRFGFFGARTGPLDADLYLLIIS